MRYCSADLSAFFFPVDTLSDGADDEREAEVFSWVVTVLPLVLEVIRFVELTGVLLAKESVHPQIEAVRTALVKRIAKSFLNILSIPFYYFADIYNITQILQNIK